jgi:uncharacterized protein YegL
MSSRRLYALAAGSILLSAQIVASCGSSSSNGNSPYTTTGVGTGFTGTVGGPGAGGSQASGTGGSNGVGGSSNGVGGSSNGVGGSSNGTGGSGQSPDGGTGKNYTFPLTFTPLSPASTSTANISLYFSVTDKNGIGVTGLPTMLELPPNDMDPYNWVYREDNVDLDPTESGFSVTPLMGNTLDMPTVLVLDLSGSITANGVLGTLKSAANTIIDNMLPEQRLAIMTFADTATVRVPFTTDKTMLKSAVSALSMGDGVSTNLFGAMIQAYGMWQDGFAGGVASANAKLTAGLAIVITDGNDDAGVSTLSDALAAGKNKRVISVGVGGTQMNASTLRQMATTGTYIPVTSYQTLATDVGKVTSAMQTLGKSIYTANYCSPKRAGTHELMFSVKGNGDSTAMTTCTPATFPASQPGMCVNLGATFTQACGFTKGPTTYTCCQADTPYTCPNDSFCYPTAEAAAAKCGSSMAGSSGCIRCGGTGMGATQDTQLQPGPAIHVRFTATSYSSGQCPKFWGPNCKALQDCCTNKAPAIQMANCDSQLMSAQGNEATCLTETMNFCPTLGPQCMALSTCCGTFTGSSYQQTCQTAFVNARGMEAQCTTLANEYCPTGPNCSSLKTCCGGFAPATQQQCYAALVRSNANETTCGLQSTSYCPTSANCQNLQSCCATKTGTARDACERQLVGAAGDDATCQSYLTSNQCPVPSK